MNHVTKSVSDNGFDGTIIEIECHISNNLPSIVIVGFGNKSIDEAKERLRAAFTNSLLPLPRKKITLNLAPADMPKDGSNLDLAMACSILGATGHIDTKTVSKFIIIGELGLNGDIRPVRGIIGKILSAKLQGYTQFIIPSSNMRQASIVPDVSIYSFSTLKELVDALRLNNIDSYYIKPELTDTSMNENNEIDFSEVKGQALAKRALLIAAAGKHNILLSGPPGTGKTMLAKAFISILPDLTSEEMLSATHLHSLGQNNFDNILHRPPLRAPHHTASEVSIIGGGSKPKPGEISLSHHGVLFLDELPEFNRTTIETLRQPLEDYVITIARAKGTTTYPADFILIATQNPCPCGYFGSSKQCSCTASEIHKYQKKVSGPILDRIDLCVDVDTVEYSVLLADSSLQKQNADLKKTIQKTRNIQQQRNGKNQYNGRLSNKTLKKSLKITDASKIMLDKAAEKLNLSVRAYMKTLKVAQTIADLEDSPDILPQHIAEALQFRRKETASSL